MHYNSILIYINIKTKVNEIVFLNSESFQFLNFISNRFCINRILKITKMFNIDNKIIERAWKLYFIIVLYNVILAYIKYLTNIKTRINIDTISINSDFDVVAKFAKIIHFIFICNIKNVLQLADIFLFIYPKVNLSILHRFSILSWEIQIFYKGSDIDFFTS